MPSLRCLFSGLVLLLATWAGQSLAQDLPKSEIAEEKDVEYGTLSLVVENDYFAGTDQEYTNGFRVAYLRPKGSVSDLTALLGRTLLGVDDRRKLYGGVAFGQNLYTPSDITQSAPQAGDHPYAGWLYGEVAAIADDDTHVETVTANIGIVGPLALGEFVQNTFHQLIDSDIAQGWDNQLSNEPGLIISYDKTWRPFKEQTRPWGFDLLPSAGLSLGNVLTQGMAGLTLRLGPDLENDLGPPRIRPSLAGGGFIDGKARRLNWYFFGGVQSRLVLRNIFLDGNSFRNSARVNKRNLVHDFQIGAAVRWEGLRLSWTMVRRTEEFAGQADPHTFAAITLTARY
ncbi:MAG: lipid A deacylase LpxR family protein [Minwuia sp.]|nr:lipid A deacylase LpxR family protein [Minwuia sp.]